jgi:hypothetical protein
MHAAICRRRHVRHARICIVDTCVHFDRRIAHGNIVPGRCARSVHMDCTHLIVTVISLSATCMYGLMKLTREFIVGWSIRTTPYSVINEYTSKAGQVDYPWVAMSQTPSSICLHRCRPTRRWGKSEQCRAAAQPVRRRPIDTASCQTRMYNLAHRCVWPSADWLHCRLQ